MTYLQDQYNEMHPTPKSKYEQFQEWLGECPITITDYQDNVTNFAVDFEIVDEDAEKVEQCIIDGNDYKDCVDRMVDTMNDSTPPEVFIPNFHD